MVVRIGISLALMSWASAIWAQAPDTATTVSGNVYGVWNSDGSPYLVVGNLTVPSGHYLTILPGVEVRFQGYYMITVLGGLCAHGTEADSVNFVAPVAQYPGYWKYIKYSGVTSDSTLLQYSLIESGDRAVYATNCAVTLEHCTIRAHGQAPIWGQSAQLTMASCLVTDNGGSGLSLDNSSANLLNCSITYSGGSSGRGINASGGGTLTVNGGYVGQNQGAGIYGFQIGAVNLQNVEIADNGNGGVELTLCTQLAASRLVIHDNTNNGILLSSTPADGRNLTISSNGDYGIYCANANLELSSSIMDRNDLWGVFVQSAVGSLSYNDYYSNTGGNCSGADPGTGSIETDPLYESYVDRNFGLQWGSPCIDTGSPSDPLDPDETRTDMGAIFYNQSPVAPIANPQPSNYTILTAYPNPFNPVLYIQIQSPAPQNAVLKAWSADGRYLGTIWSGRLTAGRNDIGWKAEGLPSGIYFVRLENNSVAPVRCVLLK